MHTVFTRVCAWNKARYKQEHDKALTLNLIREEYQEYREATTKVDQLDALCDLVYLAMGAIWKCGASTAAMEQSQARSAEIMEVMIEAGETNPVYFISTFMDAYEDLDNYPTVQAMCNVIMAAIVQANGLGLDMAQFEQAMLIVCDSNDSKPAVRTASNVKANIDKGDTFIAPEPRLQELLDEVAKHVH